VVAVGRWQSGGEMLCFQGGLCEAGGLKDRADVGHGGRRVKGFTILFFYFFV